MKWLSGTELLNFLGHMNLIRALSKPAEEGEEKQVGSMIRMNRITINFEVKDPATKGSRDAEISLVICPDDTRQSDLWVANLTHVSVDQFKQITAFIDRFQSVTCEINRLINTLPCGVAEP